MIRTPCIGHSDVSNRYAMLAAQKLALSIIVLLLVIILSAEQTCAATYGVAMYGDARYGVGVVPGRVAPSGSGGGGAVHPRDVNSSTIPFAYEPRSSALRHTQDAAVDSTAFGSDSFEPFESTGASTVLFDEINALGLLGGTDEEAIRDMRNAIAANDFERAAKIAQETIAAAQSGERAGLIIADIKNRIGVDVEYHGIDAFTVNDGITGNIALDRSITFLTGNAVLSAPKESRITQAILRKADAALQTGDYAAGLAFAKQAEFAYEVERKMALGAPEMFVRHGITILFAAILMFVAMLLWYRMQRQRDTIIMAGNPSMKLPETGYVIRRISSSEIASWRAEYVGAGSTRKMLFWVFTVLLFLSVSAIVVFQWLAHAALEDVRAQNIEFSVDKACRHIENHRVITQAAGEDLEAIIMAGLDGGRAREDAGYMRSHIERISSGMQAIAQGTASIQGAYVVFNPDLYGTIHTTWFVREGDAFVYRPDKFENDKDYLRENATQWSLNESFSWYYDVLRNKTPQWSDAYYDADLDMYVVSYLRPLMQGDDFIGVVGIDISLDDVRRIMMRDANENTVLVLDGGGDVLFNTADDAARLSSEVVTTSSERGYATIAGYDVGYRRLPNGMTVVSAVHSEEALIPVARAHHMIHTVNAFVIVALFVLWLYTIRLLRSSSGGGHLARRHARRGKMAVLIAVILFAPVFAAVTYSWTASTLQTIEESSILLQAEHAAMIVEPATEYIVATTHHLRDIVANDFDIDLAQANGSYAAEHMTSVSMDMAAIISRTEMAAGAYAYLNADAFKGPDGGVVYAWMSVINGTVAAEIDTESAVKGYLSMANRTWRDDPDYVWYYDAVRKGRSAWTGVYYDTDLGHNCISYIEPIFKDQQLVGVVGVDLDLNAVQDVLTEDSCAACEIYLLDNAGTFALGDAHDIRSWSDVQKRMVFEQHSMMVDDQDVGYYRLLNDMLIITVIDERVDEPVLDELQDRLKMMVLFFIVLTEIVLFGFLVSALLSHRNG